MGAKAAVITGYGVNCEREVAHACRLSGFDTVDIIHISELLSSEKNINDYHFLNFAGGFLDGDDLGSAKACVSRFKYAALSGGGDKIVDQILRFIDDKKIIMGICNGFQLMVKFGILPGVSGEHTVQSATLTFNDSARFEDRWVYLKINKDSPCIFTKGEKGVYLPVRHGEGKFIAKDDQVHNKIVNGNLNAIMYSDESYSKTDVGYPLNPNGSRDGIAGICDESGRLFGMMPHPEAYLHYTNHPRWTREELSEEGMGLLFFKNAYKYVKEHLI
jgi:phosphoribosylformylglycinamidine synthase